MKICSLFLILIFIVSNSFAYENIFASLHFNSDKEIVIWIKNNITYKSDMEVHKIKDYWQTPNETITLRSGDCEDLAILFQGFLVQTGKIGQLVFIKRTKGHAICIYKNKGRYKVFDNFKIITIPKEYKNIDDIVTKYYKAKFINTIINIGI